MILITKSPKKSYWFRWFWYKNNKTRKLFNEKKILIVIADYYKDISYGLLKSALKNYLPKNFIVKIIKVPGVFEIPVSISKNLKKYHAFIALGVL